MTNIIGDIPPDTKSARLRFFFSELLSDVGISRWRTMEWWSTVVYSVLVFYIRFLVHYLGQYLYLQGTSTPVTEFVATPYMVGAGEEMGEGGAVLCVVVWCCDGMG